MKKKLSLLTLFCVLITIFFVNVMVKADMPEPGSEADPIVTKSYVDAAIDSIKKYLKSLDIDTEKKDSSNLEVVNLTTGQQLIGAEGTEIILRSGHATIIGGRGGGISDVTEGADLADGVSIPRNHLLIVPRDDYRGLTAQAENVIVLVRGAYSISN